MSNPINERNRALGESVAANLRARHFDARYFATTEEAVQAALSLIPADSRVTFGGSMSIRDSGLVAALKKTHTVFDRDEIPPAEREAFAHAHFFDDWFLASANALSEDGVIFNMDGVGNRVASLIYGPKNVLLLVGINKIAPDHDAAVARVRGTAAPINAQRLPLATPRKKTGCCADCKSPDSICCSLTVMRLCRPSGRIRVFLVGEPLGY